MTAVDLFAGCGGWDLGARAVGIDPVGLENWEPAIATRRAAGLRTIVTHLAMEPVHEWAHPNVPPVIGLIASPPCPDWSTAGTRARRDGKTGSLVDVPMVWARALHPRWLAWEQVPPALEVWEVNADELRSLGYSVWTGTLNAANYGVPQTRERAFLLASLDRPALPPEPTHARAPEPPLFGAQLQPWVSMADALGISGTVDRKQNGNPIIDMEKRPAPTLTGAAGYQNPWAIGVLHTNRGQRDDGSRQTRVLDQPAPTLTSLVGGQWFMADTSTTTVTGDRLTIEQALVLQTFPPDYPLQGSKSDQFKQVGNAVPPLLARRILETLT